MTRDTQMKLFLGYKSYRLKKISQTMKEKKEKTREKKIFLFRKLIVHAVKNLELWQKIFHLKAITSNAS